MTLLSWHSDCSTYKKYIDRGPAGQGKKDGILARIFHLSLFDSFQVDDDDGSRATTLHCTLGHKVIKMKIWFSDFTLSWQNSLYFQPGEAIFFNFLLKKCHTFMCPNMGTFGPFFAISGKNNRDFSNDLPETPLTQERRGWFFYCRFPTRSTQSGAKIKGGALV